MNALLPLPKPSASQTYVSDTSREDTNVTHGRRRESAQIGENEIDKI
jgi:hypothetical protein